MIPTIIAVVAWLLFAAWAIQIGVRKNRIFMGVVLGCAFSWVGLIVMALVPARKREIL